MRCNPRLCGLALRSCGLALLAAAGLGCGLPKITLGASVSLGNTRAEQGTAGRSRLSNALWIAVVYTAPGGREPAPEPAVQGELSP